MSTAPLSAYTKSIGAILAAVMTAVVAALTDDVVTPAELVLVGLAGVGAVGVYLVPNLPTGARAYSKGAVAFLVAGGQVLVLLIVDGVTLAEWLMVALAALAAVGIVIAPNTKGLLQLLEQDDGYVAQHAALPARPAA